MKANYTTVWNTYIKIYVCNWDPVLNHFQITMVNLYTYFRSIGTNMHNLHGDLIVNDKGHLSESE